MAPNVVSRYRLKELVARINKAESELADVSELRWELSSKRMAAEQALQKASEELERARHMDASRMVDVALGRDVAGSSDLAILEEHARSAKADCDRVDGYCAEVRTRAEEYQKEIDKLKPLASEEAQRIAGTSPEFTAMLEEAKQAESVLLRAASEIQSLKRQGVPVGSLTGLLGGLVDRFHRHGDLIPVPLHPSESTEWAQFVEALASDPDAFPPGGKQKRNR